MKRYTTYEEPLTNRVFNERQMYEVYRDLADKNEYQSFGIWLSDMLRSGVFEEIDSKEYLEKLLKEECPKYEEDCHICPYKAECTEYSYLWKEVR